MIHRAIIKEVGWGYVFSSLLEEDTEIGPLTINTALLKIPSSCGSKFGPMEERPCSDEESQLIREPARGR